MALSDVNPMLSGKKLECIRYEWGFSLEASFPLSDEAYNIVWGKEKAYL